MVNVNADESRESSEFGKSCSSPIRMVCDNQNVQRIQFIMIKQNMLKWMDISSPKKSIMKWFDVTMCLSNNKLTNILTTPLPRSSL